MKGVFVLIVHVFILVLREQAMLSQALFTPGTCQKVLYFLYPVRCRYRLSKLLKGFPFQS